MFKNISACLVLLFALAACGDPSKASIIEKARGIETRQQLESTLGKPAEVNKLGPIESWTYKASDGTVTFVVTGDKVVMDMTAGKSESKK